MPTEEGCPWGIACEDCDNHRRVEWCALEVQNHEKIGDIYKARMEGFFDGFNKAHEEYTMLIDTLAELVYCWECKYRDEPECPWDTTRSCPKDCDSCSRGERR